MTAKFWNDMFLKERQKLRYEVHFAEPHDECFYDRECIYYSVILEEDDAAGKTEEICQAVEESLSDSTEKERCCVFTDGLRYER